MNKGRTYEGSPFAIILVIYLLFKTIKGIQ